MKFPSYAPEPKWITSSIPLFNNQAVAAFGVSQFKECFSAYLCVPLRSLRLRLFQRRGRRGTQRYAEKKFELRHNPTLGGAQFKPAHYSLRNVIVPPQTGACL